MTRKRLALTAAAGLAAVTAAVGGVVLVSQGEGELSLTKISETATTVTLGWQPRGDRGYVFYADSRRVSWTADPARSSVKFSKSATTYRVEAIAQESSGEFPPEEPPPPPPTPIVTSNIVTGDTVERGETWSLTIEPDADKVEFWADGAKLAEDSSEPYEVELDLPAGQHQIGLCHWYGDVRRCEGGGVFATITITEPTTGEALPTYRISLPAEGIGFWQFYNSPTTQTTGTDGNGFRQRMVVWSTEGGMPSAFYSAGRMYAVLGFRMVQGFPGRFFNWHTQPNDRPHSWTPPYCSGGPTSSGVSPIAFDYTGDSRGLRFTSHVDSVTKCGTGIDTHQVMSQSEVESRRGQWIWLWLEVTWGHPRTGSFRIWVCSPACEATPRIIATGATTHYFEQHQVTFLQGMYNCATCAGHNQDHVFEVAASRFGRTPAEAYTDRPVLHGQSATGQTGGTGAGSSVAIAPRSSTEVEIPVGLRP